MPTPRQPWPAGADEQRREALACAEESARLLELSEECLAKATTLLVTNQPRAEVLIERAQKYGAQARALQERIQLLMVKARMGSS